MTEPKPTRDTKFKPGQSGNPKGRPAGSRNRVTIACEEILLNEAKAITTKAAELAKAGDPTALRLCIERIVPARKGAMVRFKLPELSNSGDIRAAALAVLKAVSEGQISPEEGATVSTLIEAGRKAIETDEIARRIDELEAIVDRSRR